MNTVIDFYVLANLMNSLATAATAAKKLYDTTKNEEFYSLYSRLQNEQCNILYKTWQNLASTINSNGTLSDVEYKYITVNKNKIMAIKAYRERTGAGLYDAKVAIEKFMMEKWDTMDTNDPRVKP